MVNSIIFRQDSTEILTVWPMKKQKIGIGYDFDKI